jgi:dCMP deaminase
MRWPMRFLDVARLVASWSKDPSTKVGAVATDPNTRKLLETGYNGLPRGVTDRADRMERPAKYLWTAHAEANLVAHAARSRLEGADVTVTHYCCADCTKLLINAGVRRVFVGDGQTSMPQEQFDTARQMFLEAGVEVISVP